MAYAILRVKKLKTTGAVQAVGQHNTRERETLNANPEVANRVLIGPDLSAGPVVDNDSQGAAKSPPEGPRTDVWAAVQARITEVNARIRKNGVLACEVFLGASPEFFRPRGGPAGTWDAGRLEAWEAASLAWLKKEWGDKNIVSAVVHLDETTPHLQAVVVPIDADSGRMNAAGWLNGRKALSEMQDRYAAAVEGVGLQRGVRGSVAEHTDIRDWYGQLQQPVPQVPTPEVQTPGMMMRLQPEKFAKQETARLQEEQEPAIATLATQARERQNAVNQRREAEATNRRLAHELEVEQAKRKALEATWEAEKAELVRKLDALRQISLIEAAGWYHPSELQQVGVCIGKNKAGQDRIYGANGNECGRNPIDLAKVVHGCATAAEAAAWIEIRQGAQVAKRAVVSSHTDHEVIHAVTLETDQARQKSKKDPAPMIDARFARVQQQVEQQKPSTWESLQHIFQQMRFQLERTWKATGTIYSLMDSLLDLQVTNFYPKGVPKTPGSKPHPLTDTLRELEHQDTAAHQRRAEAAVRAEADVPRGPRR